MWKVDKRLTALENTMTSKFNPKFKEMHWNATMNDEITRAACRRASIDLIGLVKPRGHDEAYRLADLLGILHQEDDATNKGGFAKRLAIWKDEKSLIRDLGALTGGRGFR